MAAMDDGMEGRAPGYRYPRRHALPVVRQLSVIDDRRNAILLALQWIIAIGAGAVAIASGSVIVYILAGIVIGSRIQCLAIIMHDACHGLLFSNRRMNDLIGDIFVAYPLMVSVDLYRANHMVHHRFTNTAQDYDYRVQRRDPDQHFPKSRAGMGKLLLRSLAGLNYYRIARAARVWAPLANMHNPRKFGFDYRLGLRLRYVLWASSPRRCAGTYWACCWCRNSCGPMCSTACGRWPSIMAPPTRMNSTARAPSSRPCSTAS